MAVARRVPGSRFVAVLAILAILALATGLALSATASRANAITLNPAEAPIPPLATQAPPQGGGGAVDADTDGGPAQSTGPSPVLVLIAALGVLVGVLLITRPRRRGPD